MKRIQLFFVLIFFTMAAMAQSLSKIEGENEIVIFDMGEHTA